VSLVGPFQLFGTRNDDPNDIVPHEHRRELRGLQVFSAWLNHTRMDALHTIDIVVQPEGQPPHIRHYLFDFSATLGSAITGAKPVWEGRDPIYGQATTLRNIAGLGVYTPGWMHAQYPGLPAVGGFDSKTFEPEKWMSLYRPGAIRQPAAGRRVLGGSTSGRFTDEDIRAIVQVAQYSDPKAARWIADCLIERRNRIARAYFATVLPLDAIGVRGTELTFVDLAVQYQYVAPRRYRVDWLTYDNKAGKPSTVLRSTSAGQAIPTEATAAPVGSYVLARIMAEGMSPEMDVHVYLRREPEGLRVVGIEREWPGRFAGRSAHRRAAGPKPVCRTGRGPQRIFDSYARALNVKLGENLSAEERSARSACPSRRPSTRSRHALLRSTLTDEADSHSAGRSTSWRSRSHCRRAGRTERRPAVPDLRDAAAEGAETFWSARASSSDSRRTRSTTRDTRTHTVSASARRACSSQSPQTAERGHRRRLSRQQGAGSLFNGHLTSSNSDVRAGDNARTARTALERLRQLVVGRVWRREVRRTVRRR
jgi:hypothetical protein